ncbi:MAG: head-tail connector protein [Holosporaceae bacterium]|nr:head-tail connector protein [Holosporaceae bacterium]
MQLNLIKKPESEIISLQETKNYLRLDHDFDDNLIASTIKSTREALESIIQKSILKQTWEYVLDNCSICNFDFGESDYPSIFCDIIKIPLPKPPIMKIVSVTIDGKEQKEVKYSVEKINYKFCLCVNCGKSICRRNKISIKIVYKAGIADKVDNIPYQLKLANLMLVANAYQERFSYKQDGVISQGVKQLLSPFLNLRIF